MAQGEGWSPPEHRLWEPFARAVREKTLAFDVLRTAVDSGWGGFDPKQSENRIVDDLLANFAEKWRANQDVDPAQVSKFFELAMDDFFDADIGDSAWSVSGNIRLEESENASRQPTGLLKRTCGYLVLLCVCVCVQLSKVLVKIYDESRHDVTTGLEYILGKDFLARTDEDGNVEKLQDQVSEQLVIVEKDEPKLPEANHTTVENTEDTPSVSDDGWETVTPRNRRRKQNKNKLG